jgi:hypothetical protein
VSQYYFGDYLRRNPVPAVCKGYAPYHRTRKGKKSFGPPKCARFPLCGDKPIVARTKTD